MQRITKIRQSLEKISGAMLIDDPFEWHSRGETSALWTPHDGDYRLETLADDRDVGFEQNDQHHQGLQPLVELPSEIEKEFSSPMLDLKVGNEIRAKVLKHGIEALAWYVPFHQNANQWGCYLSLSGILALADELAPLSSTRSRRIELATLALLRHEMMHFGVEYMAAQLELIVGRAVYWPGRYKLYDPKIGYIWLEECLANAYMLRGSRHPDQKNRCRGLFSILRSYTERMPTGYSNGGQFVTKAGFQRIMSDLAHDYVEAANCPLYTPTRDGGANLLSLFPSSVYLDPIHVPIFLVHDSNLQVISSLVLRFIPSVDQLIETVKFKKMLSKLATNDQRAWEATKKKLHLTTSLPGLDFKPWEHIENGFSVRVTGSIRAHLSFSRSDGHWDALEIGNHKKLGHG